MAKKTRTGKKAARKLVKKITKKATKKPAAKGVAAKRVAARPAAKKVPAADTGLRSVAPGFTVSDVQKSITWYSEMLGFAIKERWEHEGTLRGAEMASGDVSLFLSQDDWEQGRDRIKGQGTRMYLTTRGAVDTLADRIKAHGGTLDQEPQDHWGMRTFAVADPDGYKLTFMYTKES